MATSELCSMEYPTHEALVIPSTDLFDAVKEGNEEKLEKKEKKTKKSRLQLLQIIDRWTHTPGHEAVETGQLEMVKILLDSVYKRQRCQILWTRNGLGRTPVHIAVRNNQQDILNVILSTVDQDHRYELLQQRDGWWRTPVHEAVHGGQHEMMEVILSGVNKDQRSQLLQVRDWFNGATPVHQAIKRGEQVMIETIQNSLTSDQWFSLLIEEEPDYGWWWTTENSGLLHEYRTKARIVSAIHTAAETERCKRIEEISDQEPLTVHQINQLSPHSSRYVIPHNQKNSKMYGLILYNDFNRPGAEAEADNLGKSLNTAGILNPVKLKFSGPTELQSMIDSFLECVADSSLLIVCLMSHGGRGALQTGGVERIPVNDILCQLKQKLPVTVPLIILIQACQDASGVASKLKATDPAIPSQVSDPLQNQHITLTREHTVLLLATVREGVAKRGAFTGAMAEEFRTANGQRDINEMFNRAAGSLKTDKDCLTVNQIPEYRQTTHKLLILPRNLGN